MPLKDLIIVAALIIAVLLVAFTGNVFGSEFYFFLPGRRSGLSEPPSSPWLVAFLVAISVGIFFLSRRYFAKLFTALPILAILGLPTGALIFDWTPGISQYLLIVLLGSIAAFIWTHEHLYED